MTINQPRGPKSSWASADWTTTWVQKPNKISPKPAKGVFQVLLGVRKSCWKWFSLSESTILRKVRSFGWCLILNLLKASHSRCFQETSFSNSRLQATPAEPPHTEKNSGDGRWHLAYHVPLISFSVGNWATQIVWKVSFFSKKTGVYQARNWSQKHFETVKLIQNVHFSNLKDGMKWFSDI